MAIIFLGRNNFEHRKRLFKWAAFFFLLPERPRHPVVVALISGSQDIIIYGSYEDDETPFTEWYENYVGVPAHKVTLTGNVRVAPSLSASPSVISVGKRYAFVGYLMRL